MTVLRKYRLGFDLGRRCSAQQSPSVPVTVDNFPRAESDLYMGNALKDAGGIGKFAHHREPMQIDKQSVIRPNRDTLYSAAVFDLDAGPVTITLPDAGNRFMSLHGASTKITTCRTYFMVLARTRWTRTRSARAMYCSESARWSIRPIQMTSSRFMPCRMRSKSSQKDAGKFEVPNWDPASQKKVRDALLVLASTITDFKNAFGAKGDVDPIRHLIVTAAGWGGNPDKDATYLAVTPTKNDGSTVYKLNVPGNVPVDGFWSISLYNGEGYFQKNDTNAYSLNNITAKKGADGSVAVQFGGCDGKIENCLPIMTGWNYTVRLYRPRAEILDGTWKFPEAQAVN